MTIKKLLIGCASLCAIANASADFYAGAKLSPNFNTGKYTSFDVATPADVHSAPNGAGFSMAGGVLVGYSKWMDKIYVAGEAGYMLNGLDNKVRVSRSEDKGVNYNAPLSKLKNKSFYQLALKVGYKFSNDITPYVNLGVAGGKYELQMQNDYTEPKRGLAKQTTYKVKKNIFAFNPGLGVNLKYSENMFITAQYDVVMGPNISKNFTANSETWTYKQKIKQHNISLGLNYKF